MSARRRAALASDEGTAERRHHAPPDAIVHEVVGETVSGQVIAKRVRFKDPVEMMGLSEAIVTAALRFRDDYELAIWGGRPPDSRYADDGKGASLQPIIRSNVAMVLPADAILDAMGRYGRAIVALGPCKHVVECVVGEGYSLTEAAGLMRRNRQELAGVLKAGLEALVKLDERRG